MKNSEKDKLRGYIYQSIQEAWKEISEFLSTQDLRHTNLYQQDIERYLRNCFSRRLRYNKKKDDQLTDSDYFDPNYENYIESVVKKIRQAPISTLSNYKEIIHKLWGGIPVFESIKIHQRLYCYFIILDPKEPRKMLGVGIIFINTHNKDSVAAKHLKTLKIVTSTVYKKYKKWSEHQFILYLNPSDIQSFSYQFDFAVLETMDDSPKNEKEKTQIRKNKKKSSHIDIPKQEIKDLPQRSVKVQENCEFEWLGKVIQSRMKPMRQGRKTRRIEEIVVEGWLYPNKCDYARHDRYFVAQHPDLNIEPIEKIPKEHKRRVLLKINDFEDWPEDTAHEISDEQHLTHRTKCWFDFEQFLDADGLTGSYKAVPIAGTGMNNYKIRDLTQEEYSQVYKLPPIGIPFGLFIHDNDTTIQDYPHIKIPFYFPISIPEYEQVFYTPLFLVGRPGSGKTNALKSLCAASIYSQEYSTQKPPHFIFFDYEGQFTSLAAQNNVIKSDDDSKIWDLCGMHPIDNNDVNVLGKNMDNKLPVSFSFQQLMSNLTIEQKVDYLKYFLRDLSEVTESSFIKLAKDVFTLTSPVTYNDFKNTLFHNLNNPKNSTGSILTAGQRKAIMRTLSGEIESFFDQPGQDFNLADLVKNWKINIFDLHNLSRDKAILYVLLSIYKVKLENNTLDESIIVVIDEAHEVFQKNTGSSKDRRFYKLIAGFLSKIGSRGRKHRFGLWLASQRPQDLHKDIQKNIGTYLLLGLNSEHKRWLRATIGNTNDVDLVLGMPNRYALFKSSSLHEGDSYLLRLIRSPNKHRTFV